MIKSYQNTDTRDGEWVFRIQDDDFDIEYVAPTIWNAIEDIYKEPNLVAANIVRVLLFLTSGRSYESLDRQRYIEHMKPYLDYSKYEDAINKYLLLL